MVGQKPRPSGQLLLSLISCPKKQCFSGCFRLEEWSKKIQVSANQQKDPLKVLTPFSPEEKQVNTPYYSYHSRYPRQFGENTHCGRMSGAEGTHWCGCDGGRTAFLEGNVEVSCLFVGIYATETCINMNV
jgi:hypothetical protein